MPPHLPIQSISRSQAIRIGRGPGMVTVPSFNMGDIPTNPATGALYTVLYADLGNPQVRRDIQHHGAEGAIQTVAGAASLNVWSDLFLIAGTSTPVAAGTAFGLTVAPASASVISSRFYGPSSSLPVTGTGTNVLTIPAPSTPFDRTDQVYITPAGVLSYLVGSPAVATPVYNVFTVATTGVPTGGTFTMTFVYNGYTYLTGNIAFNASAATVATALLTSAGLVGNGVAQQMKLPAATLGGTGGALTAAPVTITASGALVGPITNLMVIGNALTGGTTPNVTLTTTVLGTGGSQYPVPAGFNLPLANVWVPSGAANAAGCTITNIPLLA